MSTLLTIVIYLSTAALVIDSFFLILLVLIQLPKKEAGAGLAFGGGTTDALFGAGSGNALTKITKYAVVFFFVLALGLSVMQNRRLVAEKNSFEAVLKQKAGEGKATPAVPGNLNDLLQKSAASLTNSMKPAVVPTNSAAATNVKTQPEAPATNSATPPKK